MISFKLINFENEGVGLLFVSQTNDNNIIRSEIKLYYTYTICKCNYYP